MADDIATLQANLADAKAKLHQLMTGQSVVEIRHGLNKYMRFNVAKIGDLRAYIADLEGKLVALGALTSGGRPRARRVAF